MPVIREDRNYTIGPIGIARLPSPVPGSNGSERIAESVANAANRMTDMFFREGVKRAEQFGTEQAAAVAREQILAIDPKTGVPKAYEPPKGFGTIARDAYQRVVLTRFQSSVEEEIKLKAKELAAIYDGSVDRYTAAMSEYIGAMAENATGQFQTYIADVGTSYLNATRTAMSIDQINRERTAAAKAAEQSIKDGNNALRSMVSVEGLSGVFSATPTPASVTGTSIDVAIKDVAEAELMPREEILKLGSDKLLAMAQGQVEYLSRNAQTSEEAQLTHLAIASGDLSMIQDKSLQFIMSALSYDDRKEVEKVSDDFLKDRADALKLVETIQSDEAKAKALLATQNSANDAQAAYPTLYQQGLTNPVNAVADVAISTMMDGNEEAAYYESIGDTASAANVRDAAKTKYSASRDALIQRSLEGLSTQEANSISAAVRAQNPNLAPANKRGEVAALISLRSVDGDLLDTVNGAVGQFIDDTATYNDKARLTAETASMTASVTQASLAMRGQDYNTIDALTQSSALAIANSNIADADKERLTKDIYTYASVAAVGRLFTDYPLSEAQMASAESYLAGRGDVENLLSTDQKKILDNINAYAAQSGDMSAVRTAMNTQIESRNKIQVELKKQEDRRKTLTEISLGLGDGSNKENQKLVEEAFTNQFGINPAELLLNPSAMSDPNNTTALNALARLSVLPESVANTFTGAALGRLSDANMASVLTGWSNLQRTTTGEGVEIISPAVKAAISPEDTGKLNMMASVYATTGSMETVRESASAFDLYNNNDTYKAKVEETLGMPLGEFVSSLKGIDGATVEEYSGIEALVLGLVGASQVNKFSLSDITDRVEKQLERSFPNPGYVMNANGGLGSSAAPSVVVGPQNEQILLDYITDRANRAAYTRDGVKVNSTEIADLRNISRSNIIVPSGLGGPIVIPEGAPADGNFPSKIFLVPSGPPTSNGASYIVMMYRPESEGGPTRLMEKVDLPSGSSIFKVMEVSTSDARFKALVREAESKRLADSIAAGEARVAADAAFNAGNLINADPNVINLSGN